MRSNHVELFDGNTLPFDYICRPTVCVAADLSRMMFNLPFVADTRTHPLSAFPLCEGVVRANVNCRSHSELRQQCFAAIINIAAAGLESIGCERL